MSAPTIPFGSSTPLSMLDLAVAGFIRVELFPGFAFCSTCNSHAVTGVAITKLRHVNRLRRLMGGSASPRSQAGGDRRKNLDSARDPEPPAAQPVPPTPSAPEASKVRPARRRVAA
jgi:hypothetical protein